jgi:DNA processing protein
VTLSGLEAEERVSRLRLARTEQVGAVTFQALLRRFGSARRALEALPDLSRRGGRLHALHPMSRADAERELAAGDRAGARLMVVGDPDYPPTLAAAEPAPPVLWLAGDTGLLNRTAIAVVGARIASSAGQRFARMLASDLGAEGILVVSGLARGIDAAAHEGALASGTAAVLAGGVDDVYPPEHQGLYEQIVARGLIVSENPPGRRAQARDFPRRNRIISGLCRGTVVVEAELRSGSLITARLAAEQGRDVWAVPGSPLDPRSRGVNDLIRQGAMVCEGAADVLRELSAVRPLDEPDRFNFTGPDLDEAALAQATARLHGTLLHHLSPVPVPIDELVRATRAPTGVVLAALVELALAGRVELHPGSLVSLTGDGPV